MASYGAPIIAPYPSQFDEKYAIDVQNEAKHVFHTENSFEISCRKSESVEDNKVVPYDFKGIGEVNVCQNRNIEPNNKYVIAPKQRYSNMLDSYSNFEIESGAERDYETNLSNDSNSKVKSDMVQLCKEHSLNSSINNCSFTSNISKPQLAATSEINCQEKLTVPQENSESNRETDRAIFRNKALANVLHTADNKLEKSKTDIARKEIFRNTGKENTVKQRKSSIQTSVKRSKKQIMPKSTVSTIKTDTNILTKKNNKKKPIIDAPKRTGNQEVWKTKYEKLKVKYMKLYSDYNDLVENYRLSEQTRKLQKRRIKELENKDKKENSID